MQARFTVDGKPVTSRLHSMLLPVLDGIGKRLPRLCHHDALEPYAACRLCLVEVIRADRARVVTACDFPVEDGMRIITSSPRLLRLRRLVAEVHLARCPEVPAVQRIAGSLGIRVPRGRLLDEQCLLCGLCERACREIVGARALCFEGRGASRALSAAHGEVPPECIGCGACAAVCPAACIDMQRGAVERLGKLPGAMRPCRHALTGMYPGALCSHSYECDTCEVDQRLRESLGTHPALALARTRPAHRRGPGPSPFPGADPGGEP